ncbi:DegT/DnrJ/EryC1/StrS family aminotransferase [Crenobacter intestini]|uniref:DegT/DnrJ/EryC1/StrS aminotransferase family protein n=1 Tax=Crenobacter intestini TaxID=2563443 RepID=A0A4T0V7B4_9NEIS|nr:DegT/DnrJ/EryC1/StrS family aminotransferase [Crenobacter intestini]TIC87196.1 DegT/DnrJ/EryC1/StrS aminotransferase family protein [Crenobacter intestini]
MKALAPLLSTTLTRRELELARALRERLPEAMDTHATRAFERRFENWLGHGHARAFMGGRAALAMAIRALDLGDNAGVIVPGFTCQCVLNALAFAGAKAQYADIEHTSLGLDVDAVRAAITPGTRAVMVQHSFGLVGRDFEAILQLAHERGLKVIEDCAHALGARHRGLPLGAYGDVAVYSFERSKVLTTIHGGVALANDAEAAQRLCALAEAAPLPAADEIDAQLVSVMHDYWVRASGDAAGAERARALWGERVLPQMWPEEFGISVPPRYGQRMPSAIARLADAQLDRLDAVLARRRAQTAYWQHWASKRGIGYFDAIDGSEPAWLRFPLWVDPALKADRHALENALGVEVGVWFTTPAHPVARTEAHCPRGMDACQRIVNLPTLLPASHPHAAA